MIIGVPKEIKNNEFRVGAAPNIVRELTNRKHSVLVQTQAGCGIGISDQAYQDAGAHIVQTPDEIFAESDLVIKVKEPQLEECKQLRSGQIIFTFLHLAPEPKLTKALLASDCIAMAYETITDSTGGLPLLAPMSEVAGRLSIQVGAHCLEKAQGGRGILLSGVPGVEPADVMILGGGMVGLNAIQIALGLGANVTVLDKSLERLRWLETQFSGRLNTVYATAEAIEHTIARSDLVVGAVLLPGAKAPKLIRRAHLDHMRSGSVIVDVAIDQGGCVETARPTTHQDPTFVVSSVVHYCVTNMPGAIPRTATFALNHATLPFILALAEKGYRRACLEDDHFRAGLNIHKGVVTHPAVANALALPCTEAEAIL